VSEQMQLQDHFASFRTALEQLGASAEEVYENLRCMATLWLAQGNSYSRQLKYTIINLCAKKAMN
jgi:hypothetical protein